ncbi:centrosomal protein of 78 kDa-like [Hylaeus anthracinus]|uniref:centrosomal protein of 78 kDa-like n=1 Tax=Hylaeus anthracinus TaxID=313031 RepID=UPI0023B98C75|nr:centrosomal protein of 78 kDa-like [Hylaeus anthracinus]
MPRYLDILCYGLRTNEKLIDLSLKGCRIGDIGCDLLLNCLRNNPSLRMLNLSACRLTNRSATSLSLFLKRRRADLLQNVWVESPLQSREEYSLKQLQGLHTLILNRNPKFGDNGVRQLMAALTIDYWLKSLSLQRCGITEHGVEIIIKLLQSNSTLSKMDLTKNRIHIDTLQVVLKLLKRKRETTETKSLKKRLQKRRNKRSLENCRQRRFLRFQERPGQSKVIENIKKKYDFERKDPCDLELQLLDVINSNVELREILSSNNTLLNTEVQERSRTEDELQKVSLELNNLKSKVLFVNSLRTKLSNKNQLLQKGLRYVFGKMESFSTAKQPEIDRSKYEVDFTATEILPLPLVQRKNNVVTRYMQRRPYCPLIRECKVVDITEC